MSLIIRKGVFTLLAVLLVLSAFTRSARSETMADYTNQPLFMSNSIPPNVLILMDSSGSMNDLAYSGGYNPATTYYGYFSPGLNYTYGTVFTINAAGPWSGNFLNWAAMRRIDVARKVIMGGLATSRTGGGNQTNIGESPSGWVKRKAGPSGSTVGLSPYQDDGVFTYEYQLESGNMVVRKVEILDTGNVTVVATYNIKVQKDQTQEPDDFVNGNLAGLMQKVKNQARWGLEFFNNSGQGPTEGGGGGGKDGGYIAEPITGTGYGSNFLTNFQNRAATDMTPLAEALYVGAGYFAFDSSMKYQNGDHPSYVTGNDPFYYSDYSQTVSCGKNFVLIITDGEPTFDTNISIVTDPDGDGYLDDVALWSHTTDLRPDLLLDGVTPNPNAVSGAGQNLEIYTVYAFGNDPAAETILQKTAKNGGFIDSNASGTPDVQSEWDNDGDGIPDTYFHASDGASLQSELLSAITSILNRATSGTAISVLATSATGAGNIYQAYFIPKKTIVEATGSRDVSWLGHLLSLNVDSLGALRDKNGNCINFSFNALQNETMVNNVSQSGGICTGAVTASTPLTSFVGYNWDAGETLLAMDPSSPSSNAATRNIYTFLDTNENGVCDGCTGLGSGELIPFDTTSTASLTKYLRTANATAATNLIDFIRGVDVAGMRDRSIGGNEWKLGDIVNSTPAVVASPSDAYNLLYGDASYAQFYNKYSTNGSSPRDVYVYVGANDGMLHAIRASNPDASIQYGTEQWAYVPYNSLPHLNWLADPGFTRVEYVDLRPKIADVQIFPCDSKHVGANALSRCWGTILIGGMRMGGGEIGDAGFDVDGDGDTAANLRKWRSSYFAMDITDPTTPNLLWEFGHNISRSALVADDNELGFAATYPSIVKVGGKWFAVFGSGTKASYVPDYGGVSAQTGSVFVVDLATGSVAAKFAVSDSASFFSDPIAVDIDFKSDNSTTPPGYDTDAIYIGETYRVSTGGGSWNGRMWRIVTNGDTNPANWAMSLLYNTPGQSITSAPAISNDEDGNIWVYFGTGRYMNQADKTDVTQQGMYGMKDICWDPTTEAWIASCLVTASTPASSYTAPSVTDIIDTTLVVVKTTGAISPTPVGMPASVTTFDGLVAEMNNHHGWYMKLTVLGERSLNKPSIVGGLVLTASFVPSNDLCGFGGNSYLYSLYYKTGTAYKKSTIGLKSSDNTVVLKRQEEPSRGMASAVAVHAGREEGAVAFVQMSTGETKTPELDPAETIQSGVVSWREM